MLAYLLGITACSTGRFQAPGDIGFQNDYGKKEESEMLTFSGLETQGEISRLLDKLYGGSGQASTASSFGREPETLTNGEEVADEELDMVESGFTTR